MSLGRLAGMLPASTSTSPAARRSSFWNSSSSASAGMWGPWPLYTVRTGTGPGASGTVVFRVRLAGLPPVFLHQSEGGGSAVLSTPRPRWCSLIPVIPTFHGIQASRWTPMIRGLGARLTPVDQGADRVPTVLRPPRISPKTSGHESERLRRRGETLRGVCLSGLCQK